jgi:hypothetical protein
MEVHGFGSGDVLIITERRFGSGRLINFRIRNNDLRNKSLIYETGDLLTNENFRVYLIQCCLAEIISFGSDSTEPQIRIAAPAPAPNKFYNIQYLDKYLFWLELVPVFFYMD